MGAFSNMDYELQNSEAAVSDAFTEDDATKRTGHIEGVRNALTVVDPAAFSVRPTPCEGLVRFP